MSFVLQIDLRFFFDFLACSSSLSIPQAGCCVRLFHREGECYVVAVGSFGGDQDSVVEQGKIARS